MLNHHVSSVQNPNVFLKTSEPWRRRWRKRWACGARPSLGLGINSVYMYLYIYIALSLSLTYIIYNDIYIERVIEPLNIPCQVRVSGFSQRCNSFTHSLTPYLPHSLFPSHSPSHSPSHYLLPRRTRSEHHIASSGCRLQTTVFVRDFRQKRKMEESLCCKGHQICQTHRIPPRINTRP